MSKKIDLNALDALDQAEFTEEKSEKKRRNVTDRFKEEKRKTVTSISVPTPLFQAISEYCEKTGISKASFFSQAAREKLKREDLDTEF
ncbi:hypothetical protein [Lysinibacillus endophyticus]|uniref:hypothetical protein n=1 Tax=Ureibacillus endophyticus TaxID=1978490 RepID=UPI00209F48F0|nr:hypothetical protein [Lysinibacillus endophyticus]MCP1146720.1 hypothetical protein [Lysinibacillus endophyticus]